MAQKLKNLKITSVDLVERGANQDAYIKFFKSKGEEMARKKSLTEVIGRAVAKALGTLSDDFMDPAEYVEKTGGEMRTSMDSILGDDTLSEEEKGEMLQKSFKEYSVELTKSARKWKKPEPDDDLDAYEEDGVEEDTEEDEIEKKCKTKEKLKGGNEMTMDVEKMTPEDKAVFKKLMEQYAAKPKAKEELKGKATEDDPKKKKEMDPESEVLKKSLEEGLAEVTAIKKQIQKAEMTSIAKKYEVLGHKPEELADKLYSYKVADEQIYKTYIEALDGALEMQEASGIFKEFGTPFGGDGTPMQKVSGIAKGLIEKDSTISSAEAIVKAFEENPDMLADYDRNYLG